MENKETIIEKYLSEAMGLLLFLFIVFLYLMFSHMAEIQNNQPVNQEEKVIIKCYIIHKVTTVYWDVENNVISDGGSYIENSTEINCEELK